MSKTDARRLLMMLALVGLVLPTVFGALRPVAAQPRPPDVVVILTDDMRASDWRALPETQALLAGGTWFERFLYPTPLCCPARATMLTGRYAHNHGAKRIFGPGGGWPAFRHHEGRTIAVALREAGFRTALFGKYLNHYRQGNVPPGWDVWPTTRFGGTPYNAKVKGKPIYSTDLWRNQAVGFINSTPEDQPLFLWFAPIAPHNPAIPARRHRDLHPDASGLDRQRLQTLAAVDEAVAAIAAAMGPRWDRACVLVLSDNGYLIDEHGRTGKGVWWDQATRVPMLVRCPGVAPGADGRLAATIDVAPTILRAAGVDAWWEMDGRALQDGWDRTGVLIEGWGEPRTKRGEERKNSLYYFGVKTADGLYVEIRGKQPRYYALADGESSNRIGEIAAAAWGKWLAAYRSCAGDGCRDADTSGP